MTAETAQRVYPKAEAPLTWEVLEAANDRADRWMKRCNEARAQIASVEELADGYGHAGQIDVANAITEALRTPPGEGGGA